MTEYQSLFLEEASELFANAYDCLLNAEENDYLDSRAIGELFRILHTIKGGGGSVDFDRLSRYAHGLENMLSLLRDGKIAYQSGMAEFLVDSFDQMQEILKAESQNRIDNAEYNIKLERLDRRAREYIGEKSDAARDDKALDADEGFALFDPAQIDAAQNPAADKNDEIYAQDVASEGFALFDPAQIEAAQAHAEQNPAADNPSAPPPESGDKTKSASIRVDLDKIDLLLNRVGELVITNSMLSRFSERLESKADRDEMGERLGQLTRHIRALQDAVMGVRMIPI